MAPTITLPQLVQMLRDASTAPAAQWPAFTNAIDPLAHVPTSVAGPCAAMLSSAARTLLRQLAHVDVEGQPAHRMTLLTLSDVLQIELNNRGREKPAYYARSDR